MDCFKKVKEWMRLSITVGTSRPVLALKNTMFENAGVPTFPQELRDRGFWVDQRANARYTVLMTLLYFLSHFRERKLLGPCELYTTVPHKFHF